MISEACRQSYGMTISKRPSCAHVSSIPIATMSTWRSPRTGALRRCPRSRAAQRKTASKSAAAATSKTMRSKAAAFDSLDAQNAFLRQFIEHIGGPKAK